MTWEWSYTREDQEGIMENIHKQPRKWLEECWAEIEAAIYPPEEDNYGQEPDFDEEKYQAALTLAKELRTEDLADIIWTYASETKRECSNGGWEAYCCPFDCHRITVP